MKVEHIERLSAAVRDNPAYVREPGLPVRVLLDGEWVPGRVLRVTAAWRIEFEDDVGEPAEIAFTADGYDPPIVPDLDYRIARMFVREVAAESEDDLVLLRPPKEIIKVPDREVRAAAVKAVDLWQRPSPVPGDLFHAMDDLAVAAGLKTTSKVVQLTGTGPRVVDKWSWVDLQYDFMPLPARQPKNAPIAGAAVSSPRTRGMKALQFGALYGTGVAALKSSNLSPSRVRGLNYQVQAEVAMATLMAMWPDSTPPMTSSEPPLSDVEEPSKYTWPEPGRSRWPRK